MGFILNFILFPTEIEILGVLVILLKWRSFSVHKILPDATPIEFFYNLLFSAKSWQNHVSIDGKKQNKNYPQSGLNPQPPDLHSNALPTELGRNLLSRRFLKWALFVSCITSHVGLWLFLESTEHDFKWRFRLATECWLSSVGRALEWRSGDCGFHPDWGQFFILLLSVNAGRILQGFGRK